MNLETINWGMVGSVATAVALVYGMFRNLKGDINDNFDAVYVKIDRMQDDISDIKERLSFLEAANIYTMPSEPSQPNSRSLAAIKMHQRRRQKVEKKDG